VHIFSGSLDNSVQELVRGSLFGQTTTTYVLEKADERNNMDEAKFRVLDFDVTL
jgi:hypothetical protein